MPKRDQKKQTSGNRNAERRNGKASKQRPGRNRNKREPLDMHSIVMFHGVWPRKLKKMPRPTFGKPKPLIDVSAN